MREEFKTWKTNKKNPLNLFIITTFSWNEKSWKTYSQKHNLLFGVKCIFILVHSEGLKKSKPIYTTEKYRFTFVRSKSQSLKYFFCFKDQTLVKVVCFASTNLSWKLLLLILAIEWCLSLKGFSRNGTSYINAEGKNKPEVIIRSFPLNPEYQILEEQQR